MEGALTPVLSQVLVFSLGAVTHLYFLVDYTLSFSESPTFHLLNH